MVDELIEEESDQAREDFDSWYEWVDYLSFGKCTSCSSGRFYVLLGVGLLSVINLVQFVAILALLIL